MSKKHKSHAYTPFSKPVLPKQNKWTSRIDRAIAWCFYGIFFLVPLVMYPTTYELFEFNKMWITFAFALIILFLWTSKMLLEKRIYLRRTPLDIPLLLFTLSQIISTVFSLDPHVSFWGYYSRFNGGLLSTLTYVFLYYCLVSVLIPSKDTPNEKPFSYKLLITSLISGGIVALWGFPSHFGYDPTCLVFRGSLDVSCWTEAFHPTVRIFSTLGQPNWMAIYMAIILPICIGFTLIKLHHVFQDRVSSSFDKLLLGIYIVLSVLLYADLLYTRSQSGIAGFWVGNILFILLYALYRKWRKLENLLEVFSVAFILDALSAFVLLKFLRDRAFQTIITLNVLFLIFTFFLGTGIGIVDKYTIGNFQSLIAPKSTPVPTASPQKAAAKAETPPAQEFGGTDSGRIRKIVWSGALKIFQQNPLFGSGVETFAYAYYSVKPKEHNLTSEWDYLYNKAHNEYLNYLSTTGAFGFLTYVAISLMFFYSLIKIFIKKRESYEAIVVSLALLAAYIAIIISNFLGFSVVIVNLFFFLIPAFIYDLADRNSLKPLILGRKEASTEDATAVAITGISIMGILVLYFEFLLITFWFADIQYSLGYNLDKVNQYVQANTALTQAVSMRPGEDTFKDEYSSNLSTLALLFAQQNQATQASQFALQAKKVSDEVTQAHPNNVVYFKTRTRVLFVLAQLDKQYYPEALAAIQKAHELAPTDAKIMYNLALLYDQSGDRAKAIEVMKQTLDIKPNYRDVYYALALYYAEAAKDHAKSNPTLASQEKQTARDYIEYSLKNVVPDDAQAKELLKSL